MENSLVNPNQIRQCGIPVCNDPTNWNKFGINVNDVFIPFNTTGMIVHFESHVPTDWEEKHSPVLLIAAETWDLPDAQLGTRMHEQNEMQTIGNLTSGLCKTQTSAIRTEHASSRAVKWGQVEQELDKLSPALNLMTFCKQLIGAVNIATDASR